MELFDLNLMIILLWVSIFACAGWMAWQEKRIATLVDDNNQHKIHIINLVRYIEWKEDERYSKIAQKIPGSVYGSDNESDQPE